jgi:hypothetical protein
MSSQQPFPTDTCVLVCSGPSLNLVDPFELGLPVVVVSTAIRLITNPHYWVLADYLNEMHGEEGNVAYQNENVAKIVPTNKISHKHNSLVRNFTEIEYADTDNSFPDRHQQLFSGRTPLLKGPHKSVTFAVQALHYLGVKNIIWVGNDLYAASPKDKYAYESTDQDLRKAYNYNVTLDQVHKTLVDWYPVATKRGFNWFSWKCGDVFESFVPKFDYEAYVKPEMSDFYSPVRNSSYPVSVVDTQKIIPRRLDKKARAELREFRKNNAVLKKKEKSENKETPVKEIVKQPVTSVVQNTPKTPVDDKKYPKYSNIRKGVVDNLNKRIKDSLR